MPTQPNAVVPPATYRPPVATPRAKPRSALDVLKIVGLVVAALTVTCGGYYALFKDELAANERERQRLVADGPAIIESRVRGILEQALTLDLAQDKACASALPAGVPRYRTASLEQLTAIVPGIIGPRDAVGGYHVAPTLTPVAPDKLAEERDYEVAQRIGKALEVGALAIVVPERGQFPAAVDDESFTPGFFVGSVIVADFQTGTVLCHAQMQAVSSASVGGGPAIGLAHGLVEIPLTGSAQSLDADYEARFAEATKAALQRIGALP